MFNNKNAKGPLYQTSITYIYTSDLGRLLMFLTLSLVVIVWQCRDPEVSPKVLGDPWRSVLGASWTESPFSKLPEYYLPLLSLEPFWPTEVRGSLRSSIGALEALPNLTLPSFNSKLRGNIPPILVHLVKNDQICKKWLRTGKWIWLSLRAPKDALIQVFWPLLG